MSRLCRMCLLPLDGDAVGGQHVPAVRCTEMLSIELDKSLRVIRSCVEEHLDMMDEENSASALFAVLSHVRGELRGFLEERPG